MFLVNPCYIRILPNTDYLTFVPICVGFCLQRIQKGCSLEMHMLTVIHVVLLFVLYVQYHVATTCKCIYMFTMTIVRNCFDNIMLRLDICSNTWVIIHIIGLVILFPELS